MTKPCVLLVSTAHPPTDPRIVYKEALTLAQQYRVICALPNANAAVLPDASIQFIRLPYFRRVWARVGLTGPWVLLRCIWLRPHIVHLYTPDFIPFAFIFQLAGARIIYEVQENLYQKFSVKTVNRGWLLQRAFRWLDQLAQRYFYLIFTEHGYLNTYQTLAKPHTVIYNYPVLSSIASFRQGYRVNPAQVDFFYIGRISIERAFDTLVAALAKVKLRYPWFRMHLFGECTFSMREAEQLPGYNTVNDNLIFYGYTDQQTAFQKSSTMAVGIALLKPVGDYCESYPTKLFEYMALGLPVITSDFILYRAIVEQHQCGVCICPTDVAMLADQLIYLLDHRIEAEQMGRRGQQAVYNEYNWQTEGRKLLNFYKDVVFNKDI